MERFVEKVGITMPELMLKYPTLYFAYMGMEVDPILPDGSFKGSMYGRGGMYDESQRDSVIDRDGKVMSVKDAYSLCTYPAF